MTGSLLTVERLINVIYVHSVVSRYFFNDAEVKPFDPAQIATECFGGEMTVTVIYLLSYFKFNSLY